MLTTIGEFQVKVLVCLNLRRKVQVDCFVVYNCFLAESRQAKWHQRLSYLPPLFQLTKHSPSLQKASHSNPRPIFSNCMQNDVTLVPFLPDDFLQKKQLYTTCLF